MGFLPTAKLSLAIAIVSLSAVSGCSSIRPDWKDCSHLLSAPKEGMRSDLQFSDGNAHQPVEARLNGVSAQCHGDEDTIYMAVNAGLKVKRDLANGAEVLRLQVPFLISLLDKDDKPYDLNSSGYRVAFPKNEDTLYPVAGFKLELKQGGRAVIALTPEAVDIN